MKLLTCYTPSHKIFLSQFFETLDQSGLDVIIRQHSQECETGEFASEGWNTTTKRKFQFLLEYMYKMEPDEEFIFSDIDVQFFQNPKIFCRKALRDRDIVFQNDYYGHACTGFFYAKNNAAVTNLISNAVAVIKEHRDDQAAVNHLLKSHKIEYGLLPPQFFTFGMFYNHWHGEQEFPLPDNIVMHHANWVKGVENKIELLKVVRDLYNRKHASA